MPGGASIRWNPYIYSHGNPTTLTDPTGLCPEWGLGKSVCEFLSDTLSAGFDIPREAFDDKGLDEVAQLALYTGLYAGSQLPSLITDRSGGYTRTENLENARAFFEEVGLAIMYEPMDYAQSGMALLRGELSALETAFLFAPGLSAGLLRRVDNVGDAGRQVNKASDARYVDDVAGGSGRVRTAARRGSADGGRSLAMRRAWFADDANTTRDFAHAGSLESIQNILKKGLSESAAKAKSRGGAVNRPGSFFTVEVTPSTFSLIATNLLAFAHRHSPKPAMLIMSLPEGMIRKFEASGIVENRVWDEYMETIFSPDTFPTINQGIKDGTIGTQLIDIYKDQR